MHEHAFPKVTSALWRPFQYQQKTYDLSHLDSKQMVYVQPAKGERQECRYKTDVSFSSHCFTRGLKEGEQPDPGLLYRDVREARVFDFRRYALSKYLPQIVDGLPERKCFHTGVGNFFTVEICDEDGSPAEYEIFFKAYKPAKKGSISLSVESAYVRDKPHANSKPSAKVISFYVILFNTLNKKPIRLPK